MKLIGEQFISAAPSEVFAALNDAEILRRCIPGCESLEKTSDTEMTASVTLKVGPVKASFTGKVELSNINPPTSYTISGQGGGVAGAAQGGADVVLSTQDGGTMLRYDVKAQISGKIAQVGARLIDSTAKKLAAQFFARLAEELSPVQEDPTQSPTPAQESSGSKKLIIAAIIAAIIGAFAYWAGN
ncbi:MAG: SRPBCC family protein [Gammaproteobacteria bacterium]